MTIEPSTPESAAVLRTPPRTRFRLGHPTFLTKGSLVVLDQALFSLAGFSSSLMLARWMSPDEFGVFSLIQSFAAMTVMIHIALVVDPFTVLGRSASSGSLGIHERLVLTAHLIVSVALALIAAPLLWVALGTSSPDRLWIALAMGVVHPLYLSIHLARRYWVVKQRFRAAVKISLAYLLALPAMFGALHLAGALTGSEAWSAGGICAGAVSVWTLVALWKEQKTGESAPSVRAIFVEHVRFGGLNLAAGVIGLAAQQLPILAATRWEGPQIPASTRAIMIPLLPAAMAISALSSAALPSVVRAWNGSDPGRAKILTSQLTAVFASAAAIYALLVWSADEWVFDLMYGSKYADAVHLFPMAAIAVVLTTVTGGCNLFLRATQRMGVLIGSSLFALLVSAVSTATLARSWGLEGVILSTVLSAAAQTLPVLAACLGRSRNGPRPEQLSPT